MAKSIAVRASQSVPFFFRPGPCLVSVTVIYGALSFPEGIASGESASTVGCCRLLSSASISCCRLHRLLWAAPSTCPITARALGSGSGRCGSRSGPPSEIFPRKFPRRHWLVIECGVAASGDVVCLWRCCCLSAVLAARQAMLPYPTLPLLHRSRVHLRLSSSVLAVHLHLHGLGSSTSPNGNVLRLATGFVFTPLGTSHVALHCLRLALARVHSACCICAFVLGVELDLAVLFILVVFAIEISLSSTLFSSLVKLPRWSHLLQPFRSLQSRRRTHLPVPSARPSSTHSERRHRR